MLKRAKEKIGACLEKYVSDRMLPATYRAYCGMTPQESRVSYERWCEAILKEMEVSQE